MRRILEKHLVLYRIFVYDVDLIPDGKSFSPMRRRKCFPILIYWMEEFVQAEKDLSLQFRGKQKSEDLKNRNHACGFLNRNKQKGNTQ